MYKILKRSRFAAMFALAGLFVTVVFSQSAVLAQSAGGNGIRISPVRTDVVINPGQTSIITLNVQNTTSGDATFKAIVNDFIAGKNDEQGQPSLILNDNEYAPSHSLKRYIAAIPDTAIKAGESKNIKVSITMPKDIAGGGYYGAVRFVPTGSNGGNNNISLTASVGSLVLVKVPGDIVEKMSLESFDVRTSEEAPSGSSFFVSNKNLHAVARFKNTGNVHLQPFGKITLKKDGKVLQTTEINNTEPKGNVLPDSVRRYTVKLDKVGSWGKYTVEGNFGFGSSGQLVSGKTSFMVVPMALIIAALVLLLLLILAIFALPRAIKRYNAGVVRKANRR